MSNQINSATSKRRPTRLKPFADTTSPPVEHPELLTPTGGNILQSSVEVELNNNQRILIMPNDLIVTKQLGRGQYGVVEEVFHDKSKSSFAVKRVPLKQANQNENNRLLMDVDILVKSTQCKNIIKFYGALIWEGDLWILMELMDCSLDKFYKIAHQKFQDNSSTFYAASICSQATNADLIPAYDVSNPVPEQVLGRMAADIVNALDYLYSIKVIHRDVKPSNILIDATGTIKLCDFGISGYLINSVACTYEAGCRPYMAPERIDPPRDKTGYGIKSDVWSLGITLVEIATGRYPYQYAQSFFEQLKSICTDESPKLPVGKFSAIFEDFIDLCLKKDYNLRPKYETLSMHPFVGNNKLFDINVYTLIVLGRPLNQSCSS